MPSIFIRSLLTAIIVLQTGVCSGSNTTSCSQPVSAFAEQAVVFPLAVSNGQRMEAAGFQFYWRETISYLHAWSTTASARSSRSLAWSDVLFIISLSFQIHTASNTPLMRTHYVFTAVPLRLAQIILWLLFSWTPLHFDHPDVLNAFQKHFAELPGQTTNDLSTPLDALRQEFIQTYQRLVNDRRLPPIERAPWNAFLYQLYADAYGVRHLSPPTQPFHQEMENLFAIRRTHDRVFQAMQLMGDASLVSDASISALLHDTIVRMSKIQEYHAQIYWHLTGHDNRPDAFPKAVRKRLPFYPLTARHAIGDALAQWEQTSGDTRNRIQESILDLLSEAETTLRIKPVSFWSRPLVRQARLSLSQSTQKTANTLYQIYTRPSERMTHVHGHLFDDSVLPLIHEYLSNRSPDTRGFMVGLAKIGFFQHPHNADEEIVQGIQGALTRIAEAHLPTALAVWDHWQAIQICDRLGIDEHDPFFQDLLNGRVLAAVVEADQPIALALPRTKKTRISTETAWAGVSEAADQWIIIGDEWDGQRSAWVTQNKRGIEIVRMRPDVSTGLSFLKLKLNEAVATPLAILHERVQRRTYDPVPDFWSSILAGTGLSFSNSPFVYQIAFSTLSLSDKFLAIIHHMVSAGMTPPMGWLLDLFRLAALNAREKTLIQAA